MSVIRLPASVTMSIASLIILACLAGAARAVDFKYYVAPGGSDRNECSTPDHACATFQHAVDLCPVGRHCSILAAPGSYSQKTNVYYYKVVTIYPLGYSVGKCDDATEVTVDNQIDGVPQRGAIFWVQDHAVLTIDCMTLDAHGKGAVGFAARQFSIGDVNNIRFGSFADSDMVTAAEMSKVNVLDPTIAGSANRFAAALNQSQITIDGKLAFRAGPAFAVAFVASVYNSIVAVRPTAISGGTEISGASYQCIDAIVERSVSLPGGDSPYSGNTDCHVFGPPEDRGPNDKRIGQISAALSSLRTELSEKLTELDATRAKLDATRAELEATGAATRAKLDATRAEFEATGAATRARLDATRAELKATGAATRARLDATRAEFEATGAATRARLDATDATFAVIGLNLHRSKWAAVLALIAIGAAWGMIAYLQHRRQKRLEYMLLKGVHTPSHRSDSAGPDNAR